MDNRPPKLRTANCGLHKVFSQVGFEATTLSVVESGQMIA